MHESHWCSKKSTLTAFATSIVKNDGPYLFRTDKGRLGMIFTDFKGNKLMSIHSHYRNERGDYIRYPHFFLVDTKGDKLVIKGEYRPK